MSARNRLLPIILAALISGAADHMLGADDQAGIKVSAEGMTIGVETFGPAKSGRQSCFHIRLRLESNRGQNLLLKSSSATLLLSNGRSVSDVNLIADIKGSVVVTTHFQGGTFERQIAGINGGPAITWKNAGTAAFDIVPAKRGGKTQAIAGKWSTLQDNDSSFELKMPAGTSLLLDLAWPAPSEASKVVIDGLVEIDLKKIKPAAK